MAEPFRFWPEYLQPYLHSEGIFRGPSFFWPGTPWPGPRLADYALLTWGPFGNGTAESPHVRGPGPPLSLGEVVRPTETITVAEGATTSQTFIVMGERHGAGLNASFVDGHARWLPGEELFRTDTNGQGFYWFHYLSADR